MPNLRISELPSAGPITGTELVPVSQNGTTVQTTTAAISGSISLNYPFITVTQQPLLTSSRYLQVGSGLSILDGGAQNPLSINVTGELASLISAGDGILAKSGGAITPRSVAVSGNGLSIANGNGILANPTISLSGFVSQVAGISSGFGIVARTTGPSAGLISIDGTTGQINVANGNASLGNPTISIATDPVIPGSGGITIPSGTTFQRSGSPVDGVIRYNTTTQYYEGYSNGSWRNFEITGGGPASGVTSFSAGTTGLTPSAISTGGIVLGGVLIPGNGGTGISSYATGDLLYANSTTTLDRLNIGTTSHILTSSGSAPGWTDPAAITVGAAYSATIATSATTATTATNLANGVANQIPYQTGSGATSFVVAPSIANRFLKWDGSAFSWDIAGTGGVTSVDVSGGTTGLTTSGGPITTSGTITLAGTLGVSNGGTGLFSAPANGQLLIGNGTGYTLGTITQGSNIIVTNGSGSIQISAVVGGVSSGSNIFLSNNFGGM